VTRVAVIGHLALLAVAVAACGKKAPIVQPPTVVEIIKPGPEVKVPVAVLLEAPPELLMPLTTRPPVFVSPSDPLASSALTPEEERAFRAAWFERVARIAAWEAWYRAQQAKPPPVLPAEPQPLP